MVLEDKACFVFQDSTRHLLMKIPMAKNKIFPFTLNSDMHAFEASLLEKNWLWHHGYGHYNFRSLKAFSKLKLVDGLPSLKHTREICESRVYRKHR